MSYGRKTAMDGLRKAGAFLGDIDERYVNEIKKVEAFNNIGSAVPYSQMNLGINQGEGWKERLGVDAMKAAVLTANTASRYALPAGGVTLAGKGLLDIAARFGSPADEPEPNQLPLN